MQIPYKIKMPSCELCNKTQARLNPPGDLCKDCHLNAGGIIENDNNNRDSSNEGCNEEQNNEFTQLPLNADANIFNPPISVLQDNADYIDFKKHIFQEIACIKTTLNIIQSTTERKEFDESRNYPNYRYHSQFSQPNGNYDEIQFLRHELDNKQNIINSLLGIIERNQNPEVSIRPIIKEGKESDKKIVHERKDTNTETERTKDTPNTFDKDEISRKKIYIVGDSMLNGIKEKGLQKKHHVKVRAHPGSTTDDLIDYINPIIKKKPDGIIIHGGCNDITNDIDTLKNIDRIVQCVKKKSPDTELIMSEIIIRKDIKGIDKKVELLNENIKKSCEAHNITLIRHENIMEPHLSYKKLHLNKKGISTLAYNFINCINNI